MEFQVSKFWRQLNDCLVTPSVVILSEDHFGTFRKDELKKIPINPFAINLCNSVMVKTAQGATKMFTVDVH